MKTKSIRLISTLYSPDSGPDHTYEPFCDDTENTLQILAHQTELVVSGTKQLIYLPQQLNIF